ncbi:MAG: hypothetical protein QME63_08555 [Actinomycetota bacterium]|nr:hypothetical protein [Actinomycetota bacterium]
MTNETFYVTPTGKKYHYRNCRTLTRSKTVIAISKRDALAKGYEPCGVCKPPR